MSFERFIKQGRAYQSVVSILDRGTIAVGMGAVRRFHLADFQYAVLYFDQATDRIGIEFTHNATSAGCLKVIHTPSALIISAKPFLECYGATHAAKQRYPLVWDVAEQLYIIALRSPLRA